MAKRTRQSDRWKFTNNSKTIEMEKAPNIFLGIAITLLLYSLCKVEGIEMFVGEKYETEIEYCGMQPYVFLSVLQTIGENVDQTELDLSKIEFEFNAENR